MRILQLHRRDLRGAGLNQRELATLAKVSEGHLSLALSGKRPPGPRLLRAWRTFVEPRLQHRAASRVAPPLERVLEDPVRP